MGKYEVYVSICCNTQRTFSCNHPVLWLSIDSGKQSNIYLEVNMHPLNSHSSAAPRNQPSSTYQWANCWSSKPKNTRIEMPS
jgi:hypothetical protein